MEDGFLPEDHRYLPSRPAMNYPYMHFPSNDGVQSTHFPSNNGVQSTNQTHQFPPWLAARPTIPSTIAADIAELDETFGLTPMNYHQQAQPFYPSIARHNVYTRPTYRIHHSEYSLARVGYHRVRNPTPTSGVVHSHYAVPPARAERVLFPRGLVDQNSRQDPSLNAVQRGEMPTPYALSTPETTDTQPGGGLLSGVVVQPTELDEDETLVRSLIPEELDDSEKKRVALREVLKAPWRISNEVEPEPNLLLQFMQKNAKVWKCLLYKDGRPCLESSAKKRIQALEHMRLHIDLKPFACVAPCRQSAEGCNRRYCSKDRLRKHRLGKVPCDQCGKEFLEGNLQRHKSESCPGLDANAKR